jgi:hypothetical protein
LILNFSNIFDSKNNKYSINGKAKRNKNNLFKLSNKKSKEKEETISNNNDIKKIVNSLK